MKNIGIIATALIIIGLCSCSQTLYLPSAVYQPSVDTTHRVDVQVGGMLFRGGLHGQAAYAFNNNLLIQGSYTYHTGGQVFSVGPTVQTPLGFFPEDWGTLLFIAHAGYTGQTFHRDSKLYYQDHGRRVAEHNFRIEDGARTFEQHAQCNWNGFAVQPGLQFRSLDGDLVLDFGIRSTWCYTGAFESVKTNTYYEQYYGDPSYPVIIWGNTQTLTKPDRFVWMLEPFVSISGPCTQLVYAKMQLQCRPETSAWSDITVGQFDDYFPLYIDATIGIHL